MPGRKENENAVGRKPLEFNPSWWRRAWAECLGLVLLVGLPLIFSAGAIEWPGSPDRLACGDDGNIELFTWYVLHDVQLSSIRTHGNSAEHLGPIYFYLLAPLYGLFGCSHAGLQLGAILINLLAIGGLLGVARHCGGRAAMLWAGLLVACYERFVTIPWLTSVWLPWVVILPFLATVFLCAAVISGRVYCLPAAVLAASFIVQTQLGYTLVLAVVLLVSLLSLVPRLRSWLALGPRLSGSLPKAMSIAAVLLAIVWTPPAFKQILRMPGRISETVRYFAQQGVGHSWQEAEKTLACAMAAWPASLVGVELKRAQITELFDGPSGHPAIVLLAVIPQLVLLPVCCLLARRRRRDFDSALCLLAVFLVPLCLFSIRRISGEIVFHHVFWMTALGLLNVYVIGGTVGGFFCFWVGPASLGERGPPRSRMPRAMAGRRLPTRDPQAGARVPRILPHPTVTVGGRGDADRHRSDQPLQRGRSRARFAPDSRPGLRLVQSRPRRRENRGRRRTRRGAFPGTCRPLAPRA